MSEIVKYEQVKDKVIVLRGEPVLLDADVAALYGVETRVVNQAVKNNLEKFPEGYLFKLDKQDLFQRRRADAYSCGERGQRGKISVQGQDYFLSYNRVPWMRDATINEVLNVRMSGKNAIEWPKLDVDLEVDSLRHPEHYPLLIKRNEMDYVH